MAAEESDDPHFWRDMLRRVRKRTRHAPDAEDLLHNAFLKLFDYRRENKVERPVAFMVQAAAHQAIDAHRHDSRALPDSTETFAVLRDQAPLQDEVLALRERLRRVQSGLDRLSPRTRQIFLMHKVQDMKLREIAAALGISQTAVERHLAKAMLFLTEWTKGWE